MIDDDPTEYEIIQYKLKKVDSHDVAVDFVSTLDAGLEKLAERSYDIILIDNLLPPHNDFRQTVPLIRKARYIGPIGIISSDISGNYFQSFGEFGPISACRNRKSMRAAFATSSTNSPATIHCPSTKRPDKTASRH